MIAQLAVRLRRLARWFNRAYWEVSLFNLSRAEEAPNRPGLILVQIDGLSQKQFQRALTEGNLPFLRSLLQKENYAQYAHYSGLPSATPGIQGELFYGVKTCVPAFHFKDSVTGRVFTMYDAKSAEEIERRLAETGNPPLLAEGSSYSNIFCGGAKESHFCAAALGWKGIFQVLNPLSWGFVILFHLDIFVRTFILLVLEFFLAIFDSIRGALSGQKLWMELQFVLTRVLICVLMREFVVLGARIDIVRGLPVIHVNFFGYDEQSHRRGPGSNFAHWSLRGIDDAVARIWRQAIQAERCNYDFWIYSDHGQEHTAPYPIEQGKKIEEVVSEIFGEAIFFAPASEKTLWYSRSCCVKGTVQEPVLPNAHSEKSGAKTPPVLVTGMGPLAHLYPAVELTDEILERLIHELLHKANVPLVLVPVAESSVWAYTLRGRYALPEQAAAILGEDHPFLGEVTVDLVNLCHHPHAGKIILSGWVYGQRPTTFPIENGSHAGFGPHETNGFALLPADAPLNSRRNRAYLRPLDIREAALRHLGRSTADEEAAVETAAPTFKQFRIMTYNVHGCVGMDGRLSPDRIARVIARHDLDAVALQELDVGRSRSGGVDQVETIARKLKMSFHFHPSFCVEDEKYGNAILSRYPMRLIKVGALSRLEKRKTEPRGALWVEINVAGTKLHLINSHLSLWPHERLQQVRDLLGPEWAESASCSGPVILCGDFNAAPQSLVCKHVQKKLFDAQTLLKNHQPHSTWIGRYPLSRIDHVFVSQEFDVAEIRVPRTELDKAASDHVPLIVHLTFAVTSPQGPEEGGGIPVQKDKVQHANEALENPGIAFQRGEKE